MSIGKNNKLRHIFKHYGELGQLEKLQEEINELNDEINNINRNLSEVGNSDFLSEIADVMVMCGRFRLKYNTINSTMNFKIDRQIKRIKDEVSK